MYALCTLEKILLFKSQMLEKQMTFIHYKTLFVASQHSVLVEPQIFNKFNFSGLPDCDGEQLQQADHCLRDQTGSRRRRKWPRRSRRSCRDCVIAR